MDNKIIKFDDTKIEECKFHQNKSPISIKGTDINKIVISSKFLVGKQNFKYFIGFKDSEKLTSICIIRTQMIIYKRKLDEIRRIYFLIKKSFY